MTDQPRIAPVTEPDEEQSALLGKTLLTPDAEPLNLFATLAHNPLLLKRVNALGGAFMAHGSLSKRERELVILRVAVKIGSGYELAQHRVIAARVGIEAAEIERVEKGDLASFPDGERVLLVAAEELLESNDLGEETWEGLRSSLETAQIIELIVMVGFYRMLGGLLGSLRVVVDA
jgi:4-carboxymuconolactone decarboxylase